MRKLLISIGKNRFDKRWKQKEVTWERLLEKLSKTHRTSETEAEYHMATADRKAELKDVGGFVGGAVVGGQRKKGAVPTRSLLTLDIDYGIHGVWDDITLEFSSAMALYSTHSHTKRKPRYRLIVPLSRDVNPDEYEALGRAVAGTIGIDMFDDSTYQAERLMFWPSTPKDGEYIYEHQDGEPMDVDAELSGYYRNWKDSSQWPISSRQLAIVRTGMKKAGEPTEKPGIVGRFCRAYDIHEAIATFLGEEYEPTANDSTRYTYIKGSTSGGLVTYDNKFAYSHHGTDPTGGMLCNAFDLVRLHLYGDLDENTREQTEVTKRPSYKAMEKLVGEDTEVKALEAEELRASLMEEFGDIVNNDDEEDTDNEGKEGKEDKEDKWAWAKDLDRTKNGDIKSSIGNILMILENAPGLKGNLLRNELTRTDVIKENLPWRKATDKAKGQYWSNDDDAQLLVWLENKFGITGKEKILNAKTDVACRHSFHPVRQYLLPLKWDGAERIETLFIDYLGAEDNPLTRAVTRKSLVAAVARVMRPGCKYDYITVLQGLEGVGKSTLLSTLGGDWYSDSVNTFSGKEGMEQIQGAWIIEAAEFNAVKRHEVEEVKAFVSRQEDIFRPAYGRVKERYPRQCVFFSTTNEAEFLRGDNGNRRFWVIPCTVSERTKDAWSIDQALRGQIWAEALHYYKEGEELFLSRELEAQMRGRQADFNEAQNDARVGVIEEYLDKMLPVDWGGFDENERRTYLADEDAQQKKGVNRRTRVCAAEILVECFRERMDGNTKYKVREINNLMKQVKGWRPTKNGIRFPQYGFQRGFVRINILAEDDEI